MTMNREQRKRYEEIKKQIMNAFWYFKLLK
jgi:hypothetical protein